MILQVISVLRALIKSPPVGSEQDGVSFLGDLVTYDG